MSAFEGTHIVAIDGSQPTLKDLGGVHCRRHRKPTYHQAKRRSPFRELWLSRTDGGLPGPFKAMTRSNTIANGATGNADISHNRETAAEATRQDVSFLPEGEIPFRVRVKHPRKWQREISRS